jgi:diguanylate cyclase (GGDEF)-like protein
MTQCAIKIAAQIRERISQPYSFEGKEVCVTASIGLAAYPADGEHYEVLLSCADAAMYRDKAARREHAEANNAVGMSSAEHQQRLTP